MIKKTLTLVILPVVESDTKPYGYKVLAKRFLPFKGVMDHFTSGGLQKVGLVLE